MALGFKVNYEEYVELTNESDPDDDYSRDSTFTSRNILGIELDQTSSLHFDVTGDFSLEELQNNNGKVFLYYIGLDNADSFGTDKNLEVRFVEVFLTEEKAVNLKKAVALVEKAKKAHDENDKKLLKSLNQEMKNLGFNHNLEKNTKNHPVSVFTYEGENGTKRDLYIDWGDSHNQKFNDDVESLNCKINKEKKLKIK